MSRKNQRWPEGYVTRAELARAAGKGKTTIRRWEQEGKIKPIIGPGGVRLFRLEDVKRLCGAESVEPLARARAYVPTADTADGAIGAAVFERLLQGMPPVKIVTDLKNVHPDIIAGFIARYERMSGGMFFNERQRYNLCASLQIRRDADAAAIYQKVIELLQDRTCRSCHDAVGHYCDACVEAYEQNSADAAAQRTAAEHAAAGWMAAKQAAKTTRNDGQRSPPRDDERGDVEPMMYEQARARTAPTTAPPSESTTESVGRARNRRDADSRAAWRSRPPSQRTQSVPIRHVPARPGQPATIGDTATDEAPSKSAASRTGDAREDIASDGVPPELFQELMRLNAAPIPDDPAQLEAQIHEMDRIQSAIAEHLRARSSTAG